jgi:hypothetical protein
MLLVATDYCNWRSVDHGESPARCGWEAVGEPASGAAGLMAG